MANLHRSTFVSAAFSRKEQLLGKANWNYQLANLKEYAREPMEPRYSSSYSVKLRQGQLLVRQAGEDKEIHLLSSRDEKFLAEWLQYSPARLVRIDPALGELRLKAWANICKQFGKATFLQIPRYQELPEYRSPICWILKRSLDWLVAAILLIVFSPVLLLLLLLVRIYSSESIFTQQWYVGKRGKLFEIYQLRITVIDADNTVKHKTLGHWIGKYGLNKLLQLFNVLKGEMSIVGRRQEPLSKAIEMSLEEQKCLNALPGITDVWQVKDKLSKLNFDKFDDCARSYLHYWSLWQDLKILLLTIPKFITGFSI